MILNEKEKKIINKYGRFDYACEDIFLNIYFAKSCTDDFNTVCNLMKKVIIEELRDNNIEIDSNIKFNIDEILNDEFDKGEIELPNFDITSIKNFDTLNSYFRNLISSTTTSEEIEEYKLELSMLNLRPFLSSYVPEILKNMDNQYYRCVEEDNTFDDEKTESVDYNEIFSVFDEKNTSKTEENNLNNEEFDSIDEDDFSSFDEFPKLEISDLNKEGKKEIENEKLTELLKFINTIPELINCRINYEKESQILQLEYQKKKLEEFYSNEEFMKDFSKIMEHDSNHRYWFHGTQCLEDAYSILEQGLGLTQEDISSTAYCEFTMDEVILYSRGFVGEIGRDAIVIIDMPVINNKTQNIIEKINSDSNINFAPSGLQGLDGKANYIIDKKYIVGIVDKQNKKIIFNPKYYLNKQSDKISEELNSNLINNIEEPQSNNKHR